MLTPAQRERLWRICLKRGIIAPAAELYGPIGGFYDFGPIGAAIKRRIENLWRVMFVRRHGFFEIETPIILPEAVVRASGHLDHFTDPIVTCQNCGIKWRADHLLEENEIPTVGKTIDEINAILEEVRVVCPSCKANVKELSFFNLMFTTNIGPVEGTPGYARPETAQGIFLAFPRIYRNVGKLPIGIAQIGKMMRNEISPRQGLIRLREFTGMEVEYFFDPKDPTIEFFSRVANKKIRILTADAQERGLEVEELTCAQVLEREIVPNEIFAYFLGQTVEFYEALGIPGYAMTWREHMPHELSHYSRATFDLEIETSYGKLEAVGLAYRTDFDLRCHSAASGKDLFVTTQDGRKIIPHVIEPSMGSDRALWCALEWAWRDGKDRGWEWLDLPPAIAPYDCAIFPLMKKDGLAEKAKEIYNELKEEIECYYDESGSIGKRYARADEIGVKWTITIDYQTLKDNTVTIRDRNTTQQERINVFDIPRRVT